MNLNNSKELIVNNEFFPDLGIIISYGKGDNIVPNGVFFIDGYYDQEGNKLYQLPEDKTGVIVEFAESEIADDFSVRKKKDGLTVLMPYEKVKKLYSRVAERNYEEIDKLLGKDDYGRKKIAVLQEVLSEVMAENPEFAKEGFPGFKLEPLESLDGELFASDGTVMGLNYSVCPFLYSFIKELFLERMKENNVPKDKIPQLLYNYIFVSSNLLEQKEEQKELPGGIIYEPGSGPAVPEIEYLEEEKEFRYK